MKEKNVRRWRVYMDVKDDLRIVLGEKERGRKVYVVRKEKICEKKIVIGKSGRDDGRISEEMNSVVKV